MTYLKTPALSVDDNDEPPVAALSLALVLSTTVPAVTSSSLMTRGLALLDDEAIPAPTFPNYDNSLAYSLLRRRGQQSPSLPALASPDDTTTATSSPSLTRAMTVAIPSVR